MNIPIPSEEVNQEDYEEDTAADEEDLIEDEIAKTEPKVYKLVHTSLNFSNFSS